MSLYDTLEIDREATAKEVHAAFRRRAKATHPDSGGSTDDFARIVLAHSVLIDEAKRKQYDETGAIDPLEAAKAQMAFDGLIMAAATLVEMGVDPGVTNLVAEATNMLREQGKAVRAADARSVRGLKALARLKKKFRRRSKADGIDLKAMIEAGEARRKAYYDTQIQIIEGAIEGLKTWTFEREVNIRSMMSLMSEC